MEEEFKIIPGYEKYGVDKSGNIKSLIRDLVLNQYVLNGYMTVDTFRGSLTETLPVHRAVALAWVDNTNPELFDVVNHRNGDKMDNWFENLEWTTYSGNNYHAINTGLRSDNILCKVRNFFTKEVIDFSSIAQAAEYMGLKKDARMVHLRPKMFGRLISDRYEFRFAHDTTPWFYEHRIDLVPPSRYMVTVEESDGTIKEIYSNRSLLKEYQLYDAPGKSIPILAEFANKKYPDKKFIVRDSYAEPQFRVFRNTRPSTILRILATKEQEVLEFRSLTECANYFNVDRSRILRRLNSNIDYDGWTFTHLPC